MEADILAYLNEKEFQRVRIFVRRGFILFAPLAFLRRTSFRLSIFTRRWSDLLADATRSIASVEGVIDVLPA